jgi:hypothetical protein
MVMRRKTVPYQGLEPKRETLLKTGEKCESPIHFLLR